jgi:hypothetical protein
MNDIAEILLEQIGKAFRSFPDVEEFDKLRTLLLQYKEKGWKVLFLDEIPKSQQLKAQRFYYLPQKLADQISSKGSLYTFLLEHIKHLKEESVINQNFEEAASFHEDESSLLKTEPASQEKFAREILPHYTATLFASVLVLDSEISVYLNFSQCKDHSFLKSIQNI